MEVILSEQCVSLTGMLERGLGYYLRSTKKGRYFSQRTNCTVPRDGHWRFIVLCAELAQNRLYITDIRVSCDEVKNALTEAHHFIASQNLRLSVYTARDIINLKTTFGL